MVYSSELSQPCQDERSSATVAFEEGGGGGGGGVVDVAVESSRVGQDRPPTPSPTLCTSYHC